MIRALDKLSHYGKRALFYGLCGFALALFVVSVGWATGCMLTKGCGS